MRPLISHEIHKQFFGIHDLINDYPYLLSHLIDPASVYFDKDYASFYKQCVKRFNYSVLDNGCYELGKSTSSESLSNLAIEYDVSHIVIPDVYGDWFETISLAEASIPALRKSGKKMLGVLQGNTITELMDCYDFFNGQPEVDVIGINFRKTEQVDRNLFFEYLKINRRITKKIHFLGIADPFEYEKDPLIYSIDTSNPIMCAKNSHRYGSPFYKKPIEKLAENLDMVLDEDQKNTAFSNIRTFLTIVS